MKRTRWTLLLMAWLCLGLRGETLVSPQEYQRLLVEYQQRAGEVNALQWEHASREMERRQESQALEGELARLEGEARSFSLRLERLEKERGALQQECQEGEARLARLAPEGVAALREEVEALGEEAARGRRLTYSRKRLVGPDGQLREFQVLYLGIGRCWVANFPAAMGGYGVWQEAEKAWEYHWDAALLAPLHKAFPQEESQGNDGNGSWELPL